MSEGRHARREAFRRVHLVILENRDRRGCKLDELRRHHEGVQDLRGSQVRICPIRYTRISLLSVSLKAFLYRCST